MLFGKRARAEQTAGASQGTAGAEFDEALDTVAEFLRIFGEHAFDLANVDARLVREQCEGWARHLLVRQPPPGSAPVAGGESTPQPRDWRGARRYLLEQRRNEHEWVTRSVTELREVIWTFICGLGSAVLEDRDGDDKISGQLERLRSAVAQNSIEQLKREASAAVELIESVSAERRQRMHAQVEELGSRLKALRLELAAARQRMVVDPLTQIYNRTAFDEHIARIVDLGVFFDQPACLFMADVDHFKWVNDTFGHRAGDEVLRQLGACFTRSFLRKDDFVARYGGEEFAILIEEGSIDIAKKLAARLLQAVRDLEIQHEGQTIRVTISIGLARFERGNDAGTWTERADRALYAAKRGGRDRVVVAGETGSER